MILRTTLFITGEPKQDLIAKDPKEDPINEDPKKDPITKDSKENFINEGLKENPEEHEEVNEGHVEDLITEDL